MTNREKVEEVVFLLSTIVEEIEREIETTKYPTTIEMYKNRADACKYVIEILEEVLRS